jgi:hypothetical protein
MRSTRPLHTFGLPNHSLSSMSSEPYSAAGGFSLALKGRHIPTVGLDGFVQNYK